MLKSEIRKPDTFLFYTYAANMWKFRVRTFCPSAEFVSIARLDNYRLDFMKCTDFWEGPVATTVPTANAHVWGVIWRVDKDDMAALDKQKDLHFKTHFVNDVDVLTPHMGIFRVRSYMQKVYPLPRGNRDPIPVERYPSWGYKQIIIMGAKENGIPPYYIRYLKKIKDNGCEGYIRADCLLMRYGKDVPCDCRLPTYILREPLKLYLRERRAIKMMDGEEEKMDEM